MMQIMDLRHDSFRYFFIFLIPIFFVFVSVRALWHFHYQRWICYMEARRGNGGQQGGDGRPEDAPGAPDDPERLRRLIRESLKQLILRYDDRYLGGRGQCGRWNLNNPSELAEAAHEVALDFGYMSPDSTVRSLKGLLRLRHGKEGQS